MIARSRVVAVLLAASWGLGALAQPASAPPPRFADATREAGLAGYRNLCGAPPREKGWLSEAMGAGAAWLDYDGDGTLDLFLVNGSTHDRAPGAGEPNRLYRGLGEGRFREVTAAAGVGHRGWGHGVAVGDVDNDGDPDLYVTNLGTNVLYRNLGDGTFRDVTAAAGVGDPGWGTSAAFFDMEGDGDLDLYVANYVDFDAARVPRMGSPEATARTTCTAHGVPVFCGPLGLSPAADVLYRNDGGGKFTDVTKRAGMHLPSPRYALGVVTADFDNDGDTDVYVANDSVENSLWRNRGDGTFEDVGVPMLAALSGAGRAQAGMGVDFGDYDADGWLDLVVTNFSMDLNTVYRNRQGRFFLDDSLRAGLGVTRQALSWGAGFHDLDLDGDLDLLIANGHLYPVLDDYDNGLTFRQRNHLFVNGGRGRFREAGTASGGALAHERSFRGLAFADYDEDGDMDLLATALDEGVLLMRNETPRRGRHFLLVRLIGGQGSNRDAVGARVTVVAGGRTMVRERKGGGSYLSQSDPRLHFGLGGAERVSRLTVRWPSGRVETRHDVAPDRVLTLRESSGASTP